ncbi:MAG TPA: hypothetical protein DHW02_21915 [Ktedonobacter sp.]|nr:hypothetical protein [Ktedonobacter sp.]
MKSVNTVDDYIAQAPDEVRSRLQELRATIKAAAPDAQERMSYGMPFYEYKGRLVYFQLWKNHIGLYALASEAEEHRSELQGYVAEKGTLRFPLNEQLPLALIEKLVRAKVRRNDENAH